jgi:hypothetical protein
MRNSDCKFRCNCLGYGSESIHYNGTEKRYEIIKGSLNPFDAMKYDGSSFITSPVTSYSPGAYGLYNMNGNVAELVTGDSIAVGGGWRSTGYDVRNLSVMPFKGPSPDVGFRPVLVW